MKTSHDALIAATAALVRKGRRPTAANVAAAAGISRATVYRYFPSLEMLLAEVALFEAGGPRFPARSEDLPLADAVGHLVRCVGAWACANEQALRTLLRLSLNPSTAVRRPGQRIDWIADTLAPVRHSIDPENIDRLSRALTLLIGIGPVVVMKDINGASQEQALETLEWSARTLVNAALGEAR